MPEDGTKCRFCGKKSMVGLAVLLVIALIALGIVLVIIFGRPAG